MKPDRRYSQLTNSAPMLAEIEAFLASSPMRASRFSELCLGDKSRLNQVRRCTTVRAATAARIRAFIAEHQLPTGAPQGEPVAGGAESKCAPSPVPSAPFESDSVPELSNNKRDQHERAALASARSERHDEQRMEAAVAAATRLPGETLAQAVKREAEARVRQSRSAFKSNIAHFIDGEDVGAITAHRRAKEFADVATPSALIRRAQAEWPDQCIKVKAVAEEIGVTAAEAWLRVIRAGIDCLTDPEAA